METLPDPRNTSNQLVYATTEEEIYRALCTCYGEAELLAMMAHDPRLAKFAGDGEDRWRRADVFLRKFCLHEHRQPDVSWKPFRPVDRRDADVVVHHAVGISPTTGWAAVLAGPQKSEKSALYVHNAHDSDRGWSRHRLMKRVGPPTCVDVHDVYATIVDGCTAYVVNMSDTNVPISCTSLPERPAHAVSNGALLVVAYADGQLELWRLNTELRNRFEIVLPVAQPAVVAGTNPVTGELLEQAPASVQPVVCRAMRVAFNQLGDNLLAVSLHMGAVLVCAVGDDLGVTMLHCIEMGPAPSLKEDYRLRHPPQEPAGHLCLRMLPDGRGQPVVAQCGNHVSYRSLDEPDMHAAVVPRFPTLFAPDVGPVLCVGVCGTTIVTHRRENNRIVIGSLVPGPHEPHTSTDRFGIDGSEPTHALAAAAPYSSLCVLPTVIYCLLADGMLLSSRPVGAARGTETDIPAV